MYRQPFTGEYGIFQGFGKTDFSANHTGIDFLCPAGTPIRSGERLLFRLEARRIWLLRLYPASGRHGDGV